MSSLMTPPAGDGGSPFSFPFRVGDRVRYAFPLNTDNSRAPRRDDAGTVKELQGGFAFVSFDGFTGGVLRAATDPSQWYCALHQLTLIHRALPAMDLAPPSALTLSPSSKPSNPKDAVGTRKVPFSVLPMAVILKCAEYIKDHSGRSLYVGLGLADLPVRVLCEAALGMLEGARKYGRHNYRSIGVRASVYFDATVRHSIQFMSGEDTDPDSLLHHVGKGICSMLVLCDAQLSGLWTDDRPPRVKLPRAYADAPFYTPGESVEISLAFEGIILDLTRWWEGQDTDSDGTTPLTIRVLCRLIVLREAIFQSNDIDDRRDADDDGMESGWIQEFNAKASVLIDKYPVAKDAFTANNTPPPVAPQSDDLGADF